MIRVRVSAVDAPNLGIWLEWYDRGYRKSFYSLGGYREYVRATNSNPQVGDVVEVEEKTDLFGQVKFLGLSIDQESPCVYRT